MSLAAGDTVELRVFVVRGEQTAINVRHYQVGAVGGAGITEEQFAAHMAVLLAPRYKALIGTTAHFRGCGVRKINPLPVGLEKYSTASAGFGTVVGEAMAGQLCGLISLRTNFAGRSARGRIYVPFPTEGQSDTNGRPMGAYSALLGNLGDDLIVAQTVVSGANSATLHPTIWSRKNRVGNVVLAHIEPLKWATQRRRGDFGTPNASPI